MRASMSASLVRIATRAPGLLVLLLASSLAGVTCVAVAASGVAIGVTSASDLDAIVTNESTSVSHTGVTRTERFEERVIRRDGHVWTERVIPAVAARTHAVDHDAKSEGAEHRHFDFETAARHVTREAGGTTHVEYVDHEKKWTVFVPAAEYGPVGFLGNWEAEFYLTPPALIARMPVLATRKTGRVDGAADSAVWHEEHRNGWTNRVLWSNAHRYPLAIEASRDDGTMTRRTVVRMVAATPADRLPWRRLSGYRARTYDDFMD